ncbi:MAG: GNAT family N-acetyltransferase [Holophagaceae bacterium]
MAVKDRVKASLQKATAKAKATAGSVREATSRAGTETATSARKARAAVNAAPAKVKATPARIRQARAAHVERHRPSGFTFALADSVAMLNPEHWDALTAGASVYLSRTYLQVLESARPENLRPHVALVYRDGRPVAAVSAQSVDLRGDDLPKPTAAKALRSALGTVKDRILVCGNLLSWGPHGVAFAAGEDPEALWPGVAEALYRMRRADKLLGETGLVWVKDLTPEVEATAGALRRFSYQAFDTEPNMVLTIPPTWASFEDYLKDLRGGYRNSVKKVRKDFDEAGYTLERLDAEGVAKEAATIHALYHQVHDGQKFRLASLHPDFIPRLAAELGDGFRTHLARDGAGKAVGFITTLKDQDGAVGYYIGFDKAAAASGAPIYLRLLQQTIEDAIALKAAWLSLGRTALQPKAQLGARAVPIRCHLRHRLPAMNAVVRACLNLMPEPDQAPERNAFK